MNSYKYTFVTLFLFSISANVFSASTLPQNISELVEASAPAVVNITSKKRD